VFSAKPLDKGYSFEVLKVLIYQPFGGFLDILLLGRKEQDVKQKGNSKQKPPITVSRSEGTVSKIKLLSSGSLFDIFYIRANGCISN
jgi:hypothetical protein